MTDKTAPSGDDVTAQAWRRQWLLPEGVIYLNHGAFGPSPRVVVETRRRWMEHVEAQPMQFFVRELDFELGRARRQLAEFVGAEPADLVLVDNATAGMNVVATSIALTAGDEVLLTDHEYGAVRRIWDRTCRRHDAQLKIAALPRPLESAEQVVDTIMDQVTERTRLLVFSQVTSPTAVILPAEAICAAARQRGVPVCIDGPHALAMLDVDLSRLDCDYYTASCHKWLSAPFGSGFLYVHPRRQATIEPAVISWGRTPLRELTGQHTWQDEFTWSGTRDPSAYLAVPAAIEFLKQAGLDAFRLRSHALARYARQRIAELFPRMQLASDDAVWYGSMTAVALPPGEAFSLQAALWQEHRIDVPIVGWGDGRWIRVSCHLYTQESEIDALLGALEVLLPQHGG